MAEHSRRLNDGVDIFENYSLYEKYTEILKIMADMRDLH